MSKLRVLIADDHDLMRERIVQLLSPEYDVVGTASDGPGAVDSAVLLRPDVVVLDISMPGMTGIEVARQLRSLCTPPKILLLSCHSEDVIIDAALQSGASGYVTKLRAAEQLIPAVRAISAGHTYWSPPRASTARTSEQ